MTRIFCRRCCSYVADDHLTGDEIYEQHMLAAHGENDAGTASDNYFQRLHQSDKGIAERERGWDRGERDE